MLIYGTARQTGRDNMPKWSSTANTLLAEGIQKGYLTADEAATLRNIAGQWGDTVGNYATKTYPVGRTKALVAAENHSVVSVQFGTGE
jgi:hypothetical protein